MFEERAWGTHTIECSDNPKNIIKTAVKVETDEIKETAKKKLKK